MVLNFDIIIIGKGLVGSAAAKYLCKSHQKVAIIGPDEPKDNDSALVYASHYDQARIQRIIGKDEVWTRLNVDAALEYEVIQKESGIDFHKGVGCLYVNPYGEDEYLRNLPLLAQKFNLQYSLFTTDQDQYYSGFSFPEKSVGILETSPSGYINPQLLMKAQLNIYKNTGGFTFSDTVVDITYSNDGLFVLKTETGKIYAAPKVLVATGSFMNHLNILPQKLRLKTKSEVVLLVKIMEEMVPHYSSLPSLLYEIDEEETEGIYLIQPVKYPDGNYYLKIGANSPYDIYFESLEQIQDWFRNGNSETHAPGLLKAIHKILPSLNLECVLTKKCIISRTVTGRPYIGATSMAGLFLAGGCNGYSAMCSDAIGRVASHLVLKGLIPENYPQNAFSIMYEA
ncbi:MAG: FAD-dependent oxidoreductase [Saprospiraceae bacterium]